MGVQSKIRLIIARNQVYIKTFALTIIRIFRPNLLYRLDRLNDWAQLGYYKFQNTALVSPNFGEQRVIFFGDSITEFWDLATAFPNQPYINRGIAGQTTAQLLLRLRQDVLSLSPKVVLVHAGTNDIAGNTGPMTLQMIINNYISIAELADKNGIGIIFASVLPIHDNSGIKQSHWRSPAKIQILNSWLKQYCEACHHIYLDYYSSMVDEKGMLRPELSDDGLHPNQKGYEVMAFLAEATLQKTLWRYQIYKE
uniref:Lipolytic protein G-D-S-L family n=1 Tax=Cyanothece sp. (strain PCC 7425 / ATCC 29141) TaxID=395961 RepID=B8HVA2_CYAP4